MEGIDFLQDGERIELDVRRYYAAVFLMLAVWAIPALLIVLGFYMVNQYSYMLGAGAGYLNLALICMLALVGLIAYATVIIYRRYRLILTNKRIIFVTQYGLSGHRVAQCHLEFIQDVSTHHPNIIAEMFGYGDISIETSGRDEKFVFPTCKNPTVVAARIVVLCHKSEALLEVEGGVVPALPDTIANSRRAAHRDARAMSVAAPGPAPTQPAEVLPTASGSADLPDLPYEIPSSTPTAVPRSKP